MKSTAANANEYVIFLMGQGFVLHISENKKPRLDKWKAKVLMKGDDGKCYASAKSIADPKIGEQGRKLLADGQQRPLDKDTMINAHCGR